MSGTRPISVSEPALAKAWCPRRARFWALQQTLAVTLLAGSISGCGAGEPRAAAHPDFRALQVHEARVSALAERAENAALPCAERHAAAEQCASTVEHARQDAAGVGDADLQARLLRLTQRCAAATASAQGQCADHD